MGGPPLGALEKQHGMWDHIIVETWDDDLWLQTFMELYEHLAPTFQHQTI